MGPFPQSFGNLYILLVVDYVSKLVETIACPRNDANTVVGFVQRNILNRYGALRTIISDEWQVTNCLHYFYIYPPICASACVEFKQSSDKSLLSYKEFECQSIEPIYSNII